MNLMEALKCDFCGGRLVMDDSREFATCEMCGTKYMKTTIQQKIQEIRGSVAIEGDVSVKQADFIIRGGVLEKYNGASTDVVIPNIVTYIGDGAFENCLGIKSVIIPDTVEVIGCKAFYACVNLVSIDIPSSVNEIGYQAFTNCTSLEQVKIEAKHQRFLPVFSGSPWYNRASFYFKRNGLCRYCGGKFIGSGTAIVCSVCGRSIFGM